LQEHPITRESARYLASRVNAFAAQIPSPRVVEADGGSRWKYDEESVRVLVVAKLVRASSAVNACLGIIDAGFVAEACCLMRVISDLVNEVAAVVEPLDGGSQTRAQREFIEQFFGRPSLVSRLDPDAAGVPWVSRSKLNTSFGRLGVDATAIKQWAVVEFAFDGYVHGSYGSAMELYDGGSHSFMLEGVSDLERRAKCLSLLSGKIGRALAILGLVAVRFEDAALERETGAQLGLLIRSREVEVSPGRPA
jgi:hypothetical protein